MVITPLLPALHNEIELAIPVEKFTILSAQIVMTLSINEVTKTVSVTGVMVTNKVSSTQIPGKGKPASHTV